MAKKAPKNKILQCKHKDCKKVCLTPLLLSRHQQVCSVRKNKLIKEGLYRKKLQIEEKTTDEKKVLFNANDVKIG